jgi:hypothetical protein
VAGSQIARFISFPPRWLTYDANGTSCRKLKRKFHTERESLEIASNQACRREEVVGALLQNGRTDCILKVRGPLSDNCTFIQEFRRHTFAVANAAPIGVQNHHGSG